VLVVGASRKSFINALHESPAEERLGGSLAASLWAARAGAQVLRIHDVAAMRQALLVEAALGQADRARAVLPPSAIPEACRAEAGVAEMRARP
jgi:dihydropteroate synthase